MPTQMPRFCISVPKQMLDAIDDFRFEKRINSRSAAASTLIQIGLQTLQEEAKKEKNTKSSSDND